jgi:hypothetical protein
MDLEHICAMLLIASLIGTLIRRPIGGQKSRRKTGGGARKGLADKPERQRCKGVNKDNKPSDGVLTEQGGRVGLRNQLGKLISQRFLMNSQ